MKIVSISGENLASLGKFTVRLTEGALGAAGLFAIVGPTGAGKSTLLDAVCLALYGVTPRSDVAGRAKVTNAQGEAWSAEDERHIVRRGSSSAWAEVVFHAQGDTYVARWSVGSTGAGAMKTPVLTVARAERPDEIVQQGKRACAELVERLTGMNFDNFCRSVLLAQGRFAAFLDAKVADRSHVLEALTDPHGLYRKLSVAAHARGAASARLLADARAEIDGIRVLSTAERAAVESEVSRLEAALETLRRSSAAVASDLERWADFDTATAELSRFVARAEEAAAAWAELSAERTALEEYQSVATVIAPRNTVVEARETLTRTQRAHAEAVAQAVVADTAVRDHGVRATHAAEALAALDAAHAARAPERTEALRLDARIDAATQERGSRAAAVEALETRLSELATQRAALDERASQLHARREAVGAWHRANPNAAVLAARVDAWSRPLERSIAEARARETTADRHAQGLRAHDAAHAALATATELHARSEEACRVAREDILVRVAAEEAARAAVPVGRVAEAHRGLLDLQLRVRQRDDARAAHAQRVSEQAARARADDAFADAERQRVTAEEAIPALEAAVEQARAAELLARIQAGTAAQRAALRDGEPCQVCGSAHHPWAEQGAIVVTADATHARETAERTLKTTVDQRNDAATRAASARAKADAVGVAVERATARLESLERSWKDGASPRDGVVDVPLLDPQDLLPALVRDAEQQQAAAATAEREVEATRLAAQAAREAFDAATTALNAAVASLTTATAHAVATSTEVDAAAQALRDHDARRHQAWADAAPALAAVKDAEALFRHRPEVARETWTRLVDGHARIAAEEARIEQEQSALTTDRVAMEATERAAREQLEPARQALLDHDTALHTFRTARGALLDGLDVVVVEQRHAAERSRRADQLGAEQAAHAQAREVAAAREADVGTRTEAVDGATAALAAHAQAYDAVLATLGLGKEEAERRLAHDPATLARYRTMLQAATDARTAATLQVADATARRNDAQAMLPERTTEQLATAANAIDVERTAADRDIGAHRHALEEDDARHATRRAKEDALRALEATHGVWGRLAQVIGHHEGNTFAMFAQSLSFESLLRAANAEVRRLRPRYELTQLAATEAGSPPLEMAIRDNEFGGETRPLSTLSGGEKFLVSLSMALGLSAMASRNRALGTLFIDEGFGTLDPETLGVALDALRTLQARGTQVGIISHVGDLADVTPARVRVTKLSEGLSAVVTEA